MVGVGRAAGIFWRAGATTIIYEFLLFIKGLMEKLWLGTWLRFGLHMRLAPFVPMPIHVVQVVLRQAGLKAGDEVITTLLYV